MQRVSLGKLSLGGALLLWPMLLHSAGEKAAPSAPSRTCEIRHATWCILVGPMSITDEFQLTGPFRSAWTIRGKLTPNLPLVVLEPHGCRRGYADVPELLGYEPAFRWKGKTLSRIRVRLKLDKSCDLELLFPRLEDDPMPEAFSSGIASIQSCTNATCHGENLGFVRGLVKQRK